MIRRISGLMLLSGFLLAGCKSEARWTWRCAGDDSKIVHAQEWGGSDSAVTRVFLANGGGEAGAKAVAMSFIGDILSYSTSTGCFLTAMEHPEHLPANR